MDWIKKNLGWIAFIIWIVGTATDAIAKFFYDKDLSPLAITSFMIFATLQFVHELLNKTPKTKPWKIYSILIVSIIIVYFLWI